MNAPPGYHEYFEYRRYPLRVPSLRDGAGPKLARVYQVMTELGEERSPLYLARLVLLLMKEVGDAGRVGAAIERARTGLHA